MKRSHDGDQAERLLRRGLDYFGLTAEALAGLPKNDERKQAIPRLIRRRTTVGNGWIARELQLGHESAVSRCLRVVPYGEAEAKLCRAMGMTSCKIHELTPILLTDSLLQPLFLLFLLHACAKHNVTQ